MEQKKIVVSLGLSLPITMIASYMAYKIGNVVGKYEAYKEVANNESNKNSEK